MSTNEPKINWYPGHMKKAVRMMEDSLKLVDAVVEVRDARIPESSRNPDIDRLAEGKPRMVVLNRVDQADPNVTAMWRRALEQQGLAVLETDCKSGKGVNGFAAAARKLLADRIESWEAKGQVGRQLRFMVLGIPNVGKSSFINRIAGRKVAEAGDRPGVTRGKQWISLNGGIQLLDTPGILWPKLDTPQTGLALSWTGAINDEILDRELVACRLLEQLARDYPTAVEERYRVAPEENEEGYELLQRLGRKRGFLISGGEVDTERMSRILLDEYRGGKLGRISLERP
ncbi:MAG: ribosome biogenesis GTPase YlqF [Clostridiales bacterium]|nr:ribosome biogenesis GTPase YlqF [Candidatus Apopatocola equi]MCQ2438198.1 ribosome biogenesis GTPase YlqF [Oscillospiraceae bacterium]